MTETVPDYVIEGPIFLYRIVGIQDPRTDKELIEVENLSRHYVCDLVSPLRQHVWASGEIEAACGRDVFYTLMRYGMPLKVELPEERHQVPSKGCGCGIYGFFGWLDASRATSLSPHLRAPSSSRGVQQIQTVAVIQVWGRYVKHRQGLRVQHAKVLGLIGGEFHKSLLKPEYSYIDWYPTGQDMERAVEYEHRYGRAGGRFDTPAGYDPNREVSGASYARAFARASQSAGLATAGFQKLVELFKTNPPSHFKAPGA